MILLSYPLHLLLCSKFSWLNLQLPLDQLPTPDPTIRTIPTIPTIGPLRSSLPSRSSSHTTHPFKLLAIQSWKPSLLRNSWITLGAQTFQPCQRTLGGLPHSNPVHPPLHQIPSALFLTSCNILAPWACQELIEVCPPPGFAGLFCWLLSYLLRCLLHCHFLAEAFPSILSLQQWPHQSSLFLSLIDWLHSTEKTNSRNSHSANILTP